MRVGVHPLYSVLVFQLSYVVTLKLQINILYPCANILQSSRCMDYNYRCTIFLSAREATIYRANSIVKIPLSFE